MIFIISIIATILSIFILLVNPTYGLLITMMLKPIIDSTWETFFFGINLLQIISVSLPILFLFHLSRYKQYKITKIPLGKTALLFFIWNVVVVIGMIAVHAKYMEAFDYFFRNLNFFMSIFLLPLVVKNKILFRKLLIILLISGFYPMLMGLYQSITGEIWQYRTTTYGMVRYVGLYHDAFSFRAYGFQTIVAIILMLVYFTPKNYILKALLVIYSIICSMVIFNVYSKAAIVIALSWSLIWLFLNKGKAGSILLIIVCLVFYYITGQQIESDIHSMFIKEIGAYQGTIDEKYILSGRIYIWDYYWTQWQNLEFLVKIVGNWRNIPAHNDLLRVLFTNGVIGLLIYLCLLITAGIKLFNRYLKNKSPLTIIGIMLYTMWIIDVSGVTPSMYPAYSWFVWGFINLAILGIPDLKDPSKRKKIIAGRYLHFQPGRSIPH